MAGGKVTSPTGTAPDRYVYYPGTEELGADEMRVIACGTGMPTARRSQAAASWVAELGNGDKFIVDIGSGCAFKIANRPSLTNDNRFGPPIISLYSNRLYQFTACNHFPKRLWIILCIAVFAAVFVYSFTRNNAFVY